MQRSNKSVGIWYLYFYTHVHSVNSEKKRRPRNKEDSNQGHMDKGVAPYRCTMPLFEMEWEIKSIYIWSELFIYTNI